jgi:hypothetical protein
MWQPIETAPKDGTKILVSDHYLRSRKEIQEQKPEFYIQVAYWNDGWVIDAFTPRRGGIPAYWMLLPEPPKGEGL